VRARRCCAPFLWVRDSPEGSLDDGIVANDGPALEDKGDGLDCNIAEALTAMRSAALRVAA
jgi:hypothetical protein